MRIIIIIKIALCGLLLGTASASVFAQISNPIPDTIAPGALTVRIVDWIQVPYSGTPASPPRINLAYHSRDNSGRLFVNDQRGYLYVFDNDAISLYLDAYAVLPNALSDNIFGTGFHAFTFHPDFASNGKFYTVHMEPWLTEPADLNAPGTLPVLDSIVTEWTALDPSSNVFAGSKREMLRIEEPFFNHTIQEIGFNPNSTPGDSDYGMLYVAQGDGGILNTDRPQSLAVAHGSILRIDPAGTDGGNGGYGIPSDNPFAADANPDTLGEIWAYGFRNPHRFSWDTGGNGVMLIGDIGERNIEEINIGEAGRNYGWNLREGTFSFEIATPTLVYPLPADDASNNFTYPVAQYDHDDGFAMVGGFVYRGSALPELQGQYLFGDIVNGNIFYVPVDSLIQGQQATAYKLNLVDSSDLPVTMRGLVASSRVDLRFGITEDHEIVILSKTDGKIRRLESLAAPDVDLDGIADTSDNCLLVSNPGQIDTDEDGYGNACDPDLDNSNYVNFLDVSLFIPLFLSADPLADFNADGVVNFLDFGIMSEYFLQPPGP